MRCLSIQFGIQRGKVIRREPLKCRYSNPQFPVRFSVKLVSFDKHRTGRLVSTQQHNKAIAHSKDRKQLRKTAKNKKQIEKIMQLLLEEVKWKRICCISGYKWYFWHICWHLESHCLLIEMLVKNPIPVGSWSSCANGRNDFFKISPPFIFPSCPSLDMIWRVDF